jgi:hypothetical protein
VKAIAKEAGQFILAVGNLSIVNEADLKRLRAMLERQKSEIEQLGKFKDECGGLQSFITQLTNKITSLEKEVAANKNIAGLVLIQLKKLFSSSLSKFQNLTLTSQV